MIHTIPSHHIFGHGGSTASGQNVRPMGGKSGVILWFGHTCVLKTGKSGLQH